MPEKINLAVIGSGYWGPNLIRNIAQLSEARLHTVCDVNPRMLIETILSMLTPVCHFKSIAHRAGSYFESRLGYTLALFNGLVQWQELKPDEQGIVHLSIADFSLQHQHHQLVISGKNRYQRVYIDGEKLFEENEFHIKFVIDEEFGES